MLPSRMDSLPLDGVPPAGAARFTEWSLLLLNLLVIGATATALWLGWRSEIRNAEQDTQSTGRLLAQAIDIKFDKIAVAADALAYQLQAELQAGGIRRDSFWAAVDRARERLPEVQLLAVFDAQGRQVCGTEPTQRCRNLDVRDRPYFQAARQQTGTGYRLHGPLTSRFDEQQILVLARPLLGPDGVFAGVVAVLLPVEKLRAVLRSARRGDESLIGLRAADMTPLVRDPPLPPGAASAPLSPTLHAALARQPQGGLYRAVTLADGIDRIAYYQRLQSWPLYVLVGGAASDALAGWRAATGLAVLLLLALAVGSVLLARANRLQLAQARRAEFLYETAPCGYHSLDAQGRFIRINRTEQQWLGLSAPELLGRRSPRDFYTPASQAVFDARFPELRERGRVENVQVDMVGADGRTRHLVLSATAMVDQTGAFVGSNTVLHDITPLHQAEQQLRELAELQTLMLGNELIGMARLQDRHIVWANRGMTRLLGYSEAEFAGMPMRQLYLDDATYEQVGASSYPKLAAGEAHRIEVPMRHKDGGARWMDAGGSPLSGQGAGQVLMMLVDITDRKAAEAMRLRAVELQAQNMQLLKIAQLQDEFLANMSHELRTPLNGILGFGQLLKQPAMAADPERLQRYADQIVASGQRLLGLIQAQLDFGAAEAGKLGILRQGVDLPALLDDLSSLQQPAAAAAGVTLSAACDPELQTVVTDPLRLRQLLVLLLENALKFSHRGGEVGLRAYVLDDATWCAEVVDNGIGIDPADHARIFDKFIQLSAGSTKQFGGAGMGLPLARLLARALGGDVTVRSALGEGATFTLVLPVEVDELAPVESKDGAA